MPLQAFTTPRSSETHVLIYATQPPQPSKKARIGGWQRKIIRQKGRLKEMESRDTDELEANRKLWNKRPVGPTNTKLTFNNTGSCLLQLKVQKNPVVYCRYVFWLANILKYEYSECNSHNLICSIKYCELLLYSVIPLCEL